MNHVLHQLRGLGKGERVGKLNTLFFFFFSPPMGIVAQCRFNGGFSANSLQFGRKIGSGPLLPPGCDSQREATEPSAIPGIFLAFSHCWSACIFATWFYFISQHGLCLEVFCSLVWRYIVGVTVETQRAEQGIETSKGLLSAEAGGVYKLALLASSWARWFV